MSRTISRRFVNAAHARFRQNRCKDAMDGFENDVASERRDCG